MGTFQTVTGVFCNGASWEGFLHQYHGGFLRRCRLAGGFLHQFPRPDKATLKQKNTAGKPRFFGIFSYSRLFSS